MSIWVATPLFSIVGFLLAVAALILFDRTIPFDLVGDSVHDNPAASVVAAGLLVSQALVMYSAYTHTHSLIDFVVWSAFGIVMNTAAYHLMHLLVRRWNLNQAIHEKRQVSAGILAAGVLITAGLIIAGAMG